MNRKKMLRHDGEVRENRNKNADLQPKMLPGYVRAEKVRCGKQGCKCTRGEPHGPYFYHFTWMAGKRYRRYVRRRDVEQVRAACRSYRDFQRQLRVGQRQWRMLIATLRDST